MASNTIKRNGEWVVELLIPLNHNGKEVTEIRIKPPGFEHVIRWGHGDIPSILALLSELTDLPERLLRQITYPDVDRVMLAFTALMPPTIQGDFQNGQRQLATPMTELPVIDNVVDQVDPRFPHVEGPVQRFSKPPGGVPLPGGPPPPAATDDGTGMSVNPPQAMKAVS